MASLVTIAIYRTLWKNPFTTFGVLSFETGLNEKANMDHDDFHKLILIGQEPSWPNNRFLWCLILIGNAASVVLASTNQDDKYLQVGWSHHPGGHDRSWSELVAILCVIILIHMNIIKCHSLICLIYFKNRCVIF